MSFLTEWPTDRYGLLKNRWVNRWFGMRRPRWLALWSLVTEMLVGSEREMIPKARGTTKTGATPTVRRTNGFQCTHTVKGM